MKTPIAVLITDSHKHKDNIDQVEDIEDQAIALCKELKVNRLFHAGDVVTARIAQPLKVLESIYKFRSKLEESGLILDVIEGNHDLTSQEEVSGYNSIFQSDIYRVHGESHTESFGDKLVVHFLSYFPETGSYLDRLKKLELNIVKKKFNLLITHIAVNGGLKHESSSAGNKELPAECFKKFSKTLIGHFHQQAKVDGHEIYYVGATHPQNFSDDNSKGMSIIYSDGSHEFIKAKFTEFHTIHADVTQVDKAFMKKIKNQIDSTGDKIRVILKGDQSMLKTVNQKAFAEIGVTKLKLQDVDVSLTPKEKEESFVSYTKEEVISEYKRFALSNEIDSELGLEYLSDIKS